MSKTILYDLPSKQGGCWSLNPWKSEALHFPKFEQEQQLRFFPPARLALNFKQIPYETQWVEYPDLKKTLSAL